MSESPSLPNPNQSFTKKQFQERSVDYIMEDDVPIKKSKKQAYNSEEKEPHMEKLKASDSHKVYLRVTGMSCALCMNKIETSVIEKPGKHHIWY